MTTDASAVLGALPSPTFAPAPTPITSINPPCTISDACWNYDEEDDEHDASYDLKQPCHGWPELVNLMVQNPHFESYQAFRDLNIKSLLYYQAELVQLRRDLHGIEWRDHRKGGVSTRLCANVRSLLLTPILFLPQTKSNGTR